MGAGAEAATSSSGFRVPPPSAPGPRPLPPPPHFPRHPDLRGPAFPSTRGVPSYAARDSEHLVHIAVQTFGVCDLAPSQTNDTLRRERESQEWRRVHQEEKVLQKVSNPGTGQEAENMTRDGRVEL